MCPVCRQHTVPVYFGLSYMEDETENSDADDEDETVAFENDLRDQHAVPVFARQNIRYQQQQPVRVPATGPVIDSFGPTYIIHDRS